MKTRTVLILGDGYQITLDENSMPIDVVGFDEPIQEISEVVDDMLVHTYTIRKKEEKKGQ